MIVRRRPAGRRVRVLSSGIGDVSALVIGAQTDLPPGTLAARGMAGLGGAGQSLLDTVSGGKISAILAKLDKLEVWLKVAIACSVFAGVAAVVALKRRS